MLKNHKELNVWQKSYALCLHVYKITSGKREPWEIKRGDRGYRENAESVNQIPGKQTLGSLNPRLLEPFLPTNWEKSLI